MGTRNAALPDTAAAGAAAKSLSQKSPRTYAVVYDGTCNVCTRVIAALTKLDKRSELEMLPAQTSGLGERFPWIPQSAYNESIQLIRISDSRTWHGAAAIEQILDVIPKGKFLSWMFSIPLVRPIVEKLYRSFAKRRYRFGCNEHCRLQTNL